MRVTLRGTGFEVDKALRRDVERRVWFAFGRFRPKVGRVSVRLMDEPRGAIPGPRCVVTVGLGPLGSVKVEDGGDHEREAASRAIGRAERAVSLEFEKRRAVS